jgi:hypothetical protein
MPGAIGRPGAVFLSEGGLIAPGYDLEELDMVFLKKSQEFLEEHVRKHPGQPFFLHHCTAAGNLPSFAARELLIFAWRMTRSANVFGPFSGLPLVGLGSFAVQASIKGSTKAGPHGDYIFAFDYVVGELMKTLEKLGVADHTAVMASSDNGAEVTGVLHMRADYGHDGVRPYTLHQTISLALAIRKGPWKYLDHQGSGGNNYDEGPLRLVANPNNAPTAPGQLYNLDLDPGETNNLYFQQRTARTDHNYRPQQARCGARERRAHRQRCSQSLGRQCRENSSLSTESGLPKGLGRPSARPIRPTCVDPAVRVITMKGCAVGPAALYY